MIDYLHIAVNAAADYLFILTGLIRCENVSEPIFHLPFSLRYTSVTIKGLVTSFPPTTATKSMSFNRIAVLPKMFTKLRKLRLSYTRSAAFNGSKFLGFSPASTHVNKHRFVIKQHI